MRYNKKDEDTWAAAKRQTWEKLRTLRKVIAESSAKRKAEEESKMSHHDKKKPKKNKPKPKPKPKPKKGYKPWDKRGPRNPSDKRGPKEGDKRPKEGR